jgi:hypothetical protein
MLVLLKIAEWQSYLGDLSIKVNENVNLVQSCWEQSVHIQLMNVSYIAV